MTKYCCEGVPIVDTWEEIPKTSQQTNKIQQIRETIDICPYLSIFCFSMKSSWRHVHVLTSSLLHPETLKASPCAVQTSTDGLPLKPSAQPAFTSKLKIWSDFACKAYLWRRVESCFAGCALWCSGLLTTTCHQILRHKVVYGCLKLLFPYKHTYYTGTII